MLVFRTISNRIYDIHISLLRELHDLVKGKAKNLDIVLYIPRNFMSDIFIKEYFRVDQIEENFTIIRTRDQLNYMLGCLRTNLNKIVYASEFKHSISKDLCDLMNPDPKSKNKAFKHTNIKEYLKLRERTEMIKLFQKLIPDAIDLSKETYISDPIGCKLIKYQTHKYRYIKSSSS